MTIKQAPLRKTKSVPIPSQHLEIDPRGKDSIRGSSSRLATGDTVTVKGTKTRKPVKATWY